MHKLVDGIQVELTPEEHAVIIADWEAAAREDEQLWYGRMRAVGYPSIGDQLDAMWKFLSTLQLSGEALAMYYKIQDIKQKYPKSGG